MTFASMLVQDLVVRHVTEDGVDGYNNPALATEDRPVKGRIDRQATTETVAGRDTIVTKLVLFLPAGDPITATDQVIDPAGDVARVYAVDGAPNVVYGRGAPHHIEVPLKETTG